MQKDVSLPRLLLKMYPAFTDLAPTGHWDYPGDDEDNDLATEGSVPGIDAEAIAKRAEEAERNCPVSKALQAVEITLTSRLPRRVRHPPLSR